MYISKSFNPCLADEQKTLTELSPQTHTHENTIILSPSSWSYMCKNNNCVEQKSCQTLEPKFHFLPPPVGLGQGTLSMVGLVRDNMIRARSPPWISDRSTCQSFMWEPITLIFHSSQIHISFPSPTRDGVQGSCFERLLSLSNSPAPRGTLGRWWPIDVIEQRPGCLTRLWSRSQPPCGDNGLHARHIVNKFQLH